MATDYLNTIVIIKLVNGDEVLGMLKREYIEGSITVGNVMEIRESEQGMLMRSYLLSEVEDLTFSPSAVITYATAIDEFQELYLDSEKYWPVNAYKTFVMDKKKRTTN